MPLALIHEPGEPTESVEAGFLVRTHRGRVRPANANLDAYLMALLQFPAYCPPRGDGFHREDIDLEQDDAGWCHYRIRDSRITQERPTP